jgi:hypothetical protein
MSREYTCEVCGGVNDEGSECLTTEACVIRLRKRIEKLEKTITELQAQVDQTQIMALF